VAALALVLLLGLVGAVAMGLFEDEPGTRIKGEQTDLAPGVELSLGWVSTREEKPEVVRLARGASVPSRGHVSFRIRTDGACYLYLVRLDAAGLEMLIPESIHEAPHHHPGGAYTPLIGDRPAGRTLTGLVGRQHFTVVCSKKRLDLPGDLKPLKDALKAGGRAPEKDVVSYDVITVEVVQEEETR
jgi:hypothetical protein